MNISYQSIWNARTGTFVAVSEHAKADGKKAAGQSRRGVIIPVRFTLKSLAAAIMLSAGFNVYALPVGGAVSAGSATIGAGAGSTTITQTSQNAAINWQSFNIGSGESVNFIQPNSSAIALNRVLGSDPSSILGSLNANGKVFLVNPNGIVFGQGASVNVGGLVMVLVQAVGFVAVIGWVGTEGMRRCAAWRDRPIKPLSPLTSALAIGLGLA